MKTFGNEFSTYDTPLKEFDNDAAEFGVLSHAGLLPTAGTAIDQVYTHSTNVTALSSSWQDTGLTGATLPTGVYLVHLITQDPDNLESYSGTMSWFGAVTTSTTTDEIVLHRAGKTGTNRVYLRIARTLGSMKLQMYTGALQASYIFNIALDNSEILVYVNGSGALITIPDGTYGLTSLCAAIASRLTSQYSGLTFTCAIDSTTGAFSIQCTSNSAAVISVYTYVGSYRRQLGDGTYQDLEWGLATFLGFPKGAVTTGTGTLTVTQSTPYEFTFRRLL